MSLKESWNSIVNLADLRNEALDDDQYAENRARSKLTATRKRLAVYLMLAKVMVLGNGLDQRAGAGVAMVATLKRDLKVMVVGIIFIAIGVLLVSEIDSALPTIENTALSSDYETTLERFGTGITLAGLVLIVLPAISILRRMDVI